MQIAITQEAVLWVLSVFMVIGIIRLEWWIHVSKHIARTSNINFMDIAQIIMDNNLHKKGIDAKASREKDGKDN